MEQGRKRAAPVVLAGLLAGGLLLAGCGPVVMADGTEITVGRRAEPTGNSPAAATAPTDSFLSPTPPVPPVPTPRDVPGHLGLVDGRAFGQRVHGLHPELLRRLQHAQELMLSETGGAAAEETWGVQTVAGYRPGSRSHAAGLAVDINYYANPYVMHESGEDALDAELGPVYHRIARLMLGRDSVIPAEITEGSPDEERTLRLYEELREESRAMIGYFRLMQDREALAAHLDALRKPVRSTFWTQLLPGGAEPEAGSLQAQMLRDYVTLAGRPGPPVEGADYPAPSGMGGDRPFEGDPAYRAPEFGFLNLRRELVLALTQAGIRWGATDMGNASGDIMHFYLPRSEVGRAGTPAP